MASQAKSSLQVADQCLRCLQFYQAGTLLYYMTIKNTTGIAGSSQQSSQLISGCRIFITKGRKSRVCGLSELVKILTDVLLGVEGQEGDLGGDQLKECILLHPVLFGSNSSQAQAANTRPACCLPSLLTLL